MAQTIRRNAKPVRRQARAQGNRAKVRKARQKTNSLIDALMRVLPFTEEQLHKTFLVLILAGAAALAWLVASLAGLTALAGQQLAYAAADAGYQVSKVEVRGLERMNELKVYERVLGEEALAVTELQPKSGFYDYDAKYTDGMTEHVCPAQIPPEIERLCLDYALKAHRLLGCRGTSRSDFRWDDEQGEEGLFLLETNTQPGMTPLSLVPEQARACGIDYAELVEIVIEDALAHFGKLERTG